MRLRDALLLREVAGDLVRAAPCLEGEGARTAAAAPSNRASSSSKAREDEDHDMLHVLP